MPHFDLAGVVQLLTFRLADSVPRRLLQAYSRLLAKADACGLPAARGRVATHLEQYLGKGRGSAVLWEPSVAGIVEDSLLFFEPHEYVLLAWVIMPNHVHVVLRRCGEQSLGSIIGRVKTWTAHRIHTLCGGSGALWQRDFHDRWLRTPEAIGGAIRYVEMNPVSAGLCKSPLDWRFSSARRWPERWIGPWDSDSHVG